MSDSKIYSITFYFGGKINKATYVGKELGQRKNEHGNSGKFYTSLLAPLNLIMFINYWTLWNNGKKLVSDLKKLSDF